MGSPHVPIRNLNSELDSRQRGLYALSTLFPLILWRIFEKRRHNHTHLEKNAFFSKKFAWEVPEKRGLGKKFFKKNNIEIPKVLIWKFQHFNFIKKKVEKTGFCDFLKKFKSAPKNPDYLKNFCPYQKMVSNSRTEIPRAFQRAINFSKIPTVTYRNVCKNAKN